MFGIRLNPNPIQRKDLLKFMALIILKIRCYKFLAIAYTTGKDQFGLIQTKTKKSWPQNCLTWDHLIKQSSNQENMVKSNPIKHLREKWIMANLTSIMRKRGQILIIYFSIITYFYQLILWPYLIIYHFIIGHFNKQI